MPGSDKEDFPPDEQIIRGIRAKKEEAEELLFRKYVSRLVAVSIQMGLMEADAEEVASDVLLTALEEARAGKLGLHIGPWLYRAMRYRTIDWFRKAQTARKHEMIAAEELSLSGGEQKKEEGEKEKSVYLARQFLVRRALQNLEQQEKKRTGPKSEARDSDIIKWIAHGVTNEELAEYLDINENAARQRRFRAQERFEQELNHLKKNTS